MLKQEIDAVLTTRFADGAPHRGLVCIAAESEHLLVGTDARHQKLNDVERDLRSGDPERVSERCPGAPDDRGSRSEWLLPRIAPERQRLGTRG